jgi:hypothetical protein
MNCHADRKPPDRAKILAAEPPLYLDGRFERLRDRPKRGAKRVADRLEDVAAAPFDFKPKDLVVAAQRIAHRITVGVPASRTSFDVGEQKDNGARRKSRTPHDVQLLRRKRTRRLRAGGERGGTLFARAGFARTMTRAVEK